MINKRGGKFVLTLRRPKNHRTTCQVRNVNIDLSCLQQKYAVGIVVWFISVGMNSHGARWLTVVRNVFNF